MSPEPKRHFDPWGGLNNEPAKCPQIEKAHEPREDIHAWDKEGHPACQVYGYTEHDCRYRRN